MRKPKGYWKDWNNVELELREIMKHNHGLLPKNGKGIPSGSSLYQSLSTYHGGMQVVRERLGIARLKYCSTCGQVKDKSEFRYRTRSRSGKMEKFQDSECKQCNYQKVKDYRETDLGAAANICRFTKNRAKKKGWEYDLDREWVLDQLNAIGWKCQVTGTPFERIGKNFFDSWTSVSIDRIDSSKGYTKDNVQFVTAWVNKAKSNLPMDQFIAFCEAVVAKKGGQNGRVL